MNNNIWLYQHSSHAICSALKYSNFRDVFTIQHVDTEYPECPHDDHDHFKVFLCDNVGLKKYLQRTVAIPGLRQERRLKLQGMLDRLQDVLLTHNTSGTPYETPGLADQNGIHFSEDAWSKRLSSCLQELLNERGVTVIHSAKQALDFINFQSRQSRLGSDDIVLSSYIFCGTPDILIQDTAVITVGVDEETTEEGHHNNGAYSIECGKQALPLQQAVPDKLGELLGNMYITSVQKVMRSLSEEHEINPLVLRIGTRGLFLQKSTCGIVCSMNIPVLKIDANDAGPTVNTPVTEIGIDNFDSNALEPSSICFFVQRLLELELHKD